jgi:hypothetical protein
VDKSETLMIDDTKYVRADSLKEMASTVGGLERCIIRSYGAGVFLGYVKERKTEANGINVILVNAKRIYYWSGACSLTQLAIDGTKDPNNCKITEAVATEEIANVIEIIPVTSNAAKSLDKVEIWKK